MGIFSSTDILLPQRELLERWAVVACDQYTSQPEYWQRVRNSVNGAPSAVNMVLPEAELEGPLDRRVERIHKAMLDYIHSGSLREYRDAFVYTERVLGSGVVRKGIVGCVDLEQYDYLPDSTAPIRATEKTVVERIPPRKKVRRNAALDMSHVIMLADDEDDRILGPLSQEKEALPLLYSFDLMEQGGHISGWLLQGENARRFQQRIDAYEQSAREQRRGGMVYAVGDGNHSLATAKACYEERKAADGPHSPLRYALVELENIHDPAQKFEPIHRIVTLDDPMKLVKALDEEGTVGGHAIAWHTKDDHGTICFDAAVASLPVAALQESLDAFLASNAGVVDYIHGDQTLLDLTRAAGKIGFLLPEFGKDEFFGSISQNGVLPRKTFSMGHANEKRFYLETRKLT